MKKFILPLLCCLLTITACDSAGDSLVEKEKVEAVNSIESKVVDDKTNMQPEPFSVEETYKNPKFILKKRVALLIGNNDYKYLTPLKNPINDSRLIKNTLIELGYDVTTLENSSQSNMMKSVDEFAKKAKNAESAVFFFSGQGLQNHRAVDYILPVDAEIEKESDIAVHGINIPNLVDKISDAEALTTLIMLDACRNKLYRHRGIAISSLDSSLKPQVLVSYSAKSCNLAHDSYNDSPYAIAINQALQQSLDKPLLQLFDEVSDDVERWTNGTQVPSRIGDIQTDTYLLYQQK